MFCWHGKAVLSSIIKQFWEFLWSFKLLVSVLQMKDIPQLFWKCSVVQDKNLYVAFFMSEKEKDWKKKKKKK